ETLVLHSSSPSHLPLPPPPLLHKPNSIRSRLHLPSLQGLLKGSFPRSNRPLLTSPLSTLRHSSPTIHKIQILQNHHGDRPNHNHRPLPVQRRPLNRRLLQMRERPPRPDRQNVRQGHCCPRPALRLLHSLRGCWVHSGLGDGDAVQDLRPLHRCREWV
ncbi:unnamed protein product, partial [Linum tenue]